MVHTFSYGAHPSQYVELHRPPGGAGRPPVAVLLHGGWWRDRHDLHLMDGLARDLVAHGWAAWNVEFRRTGADGGGWPHTRGDVAAALQLLRRVADEPGTGLDLTATPAVGHSAGGHLALLGAPGSPVRRVVGLAPVTDLARCAAAGLGEDAVSPFLGPGAGPELLRAASPIDQVPFGVATLVVHGDADQRVPVEHSRDYVAAARAAGDNVDYHELPGVDHFAVIDPAHAAWSGVRDWLSGQVGAAGHRPADPVPHERP